MVSEYIYDVDIEINTKSKSINLDELKNEIELLECNPTLVTMFCDLAELSQDGNIIFFLDDSIESDEDFSDDIEIVLNLLNKKYTGLIEEGSKFEHINRNTITSISWIMEEGDWEIYQNIDRDYGYGTFDEDSEEW